MNAVPPLLPRCRRWHRGRQSSGSVQHHVASGGPTLLGEREQITGDGEHAACGAQSAIALQWFCDKLGVGDGCGVIYYFIVT